MKNTVQYAATGLLMVIVFISSRLTVFPYMYWKYATYADIPFLAVPGTIPAKCNLGCLLLFLVQLYWIFMMVKGLRRLVLQLVRKPEQFEMRLKSDYIK